MTARSLQSHSEKVNFLWSIAELLRDSFKRGKYQGVILPLTVLRRVDQVLAPTNSQPSGSAASVLGPHRVLAHPPLLAVRRVRDEVVEPAIGMTVCREHAAERDAIGVLLPGS